jgi:Spy/CpxP family protein refolding chaperone
MLRSIKQLHGAKLGAPDGEIGHVKDFYFDDQNWAVRYVVADTGSWLSGRKVLISPHAFGSLHQAGKLLLVNLTRKQIEESPAIESHKPVSRQYEEEYYRYYGWPYYWEGSGLWGMSGFPILELPAKPLPGEPASASGCSPERADAHLRSTQAVTGYHLQASDGMIGHICDFMMDDQSWAILQLVIKTGHRFSGKEVQIPTSRADRISYEKSTVSVNLTSEAVQQSPASELAPVGAADRRGQTNQQTKSERITIKQMNTKLTLLAISSSLVLAAPALLAQTTNTNTLPLTQTVKYQAALENDRSLGERSLLPPGLKEKMKLTNEQRTELKPIEDDFANTSQQYQIANQPRIDAAQEANRQARVSKDTAQIQAAREQLQQVWAGLQPYRETAVKQIKPLLTPEQLTVLEDAKNQWRENHADEVNDPSAH